MVKSLVVKIYYATFQRIKKEFPLERNETMAHYFERLAKFIKDKKEMKEK